MPSDVFGVPTRQLINAQGPISDIAARPQIFTSAVATSQTLVSVRVPGLGIAGSLHLSLTGTSSVVANQPFFAVKVNQVAVLARNPAAGANGHTRIEATLFVQGPQKLLSWWALHTSADASTEEEGTSNVVLSIPSVVSVTIGWPTVSTDAFTLTSDVWTLRGGGYARD